MVTRTQLRSAISICILFVFSALLAGAQTPYQPKFPGDPAHSDSEAAALGYMRTVIRAQQQYKRKNDNKFATSLTQLVHTGSFTKRMVATDRGDYKVSFHSRKAKDKDKDGDKDGKGYELTMTPRQLDADHRSFYASEDAIIHADDQKTADEDSPKVK